MPSKAFRALAGDDNATCCQPSPGVQGIGVSVLFTWSREPSDTGTSYAKLTGLRAVNTEVTVTQAKETDFASYARLPESEREVLEQALASIPEEILSTGDRASIESRIRNRLQREGLSRHGRGRGPLGVAEIPAVAFVGRAVGCLASGLCVLARNKS